MATKSDAPVGRLTVRDLVDELRLQAAVVADLAETTSTPSDQLAMLRTIVESREEAERFTRDPIRYSQERGVVLDPAVVGTVVNVATLGGRLQPADAARWDRSAVNDLAHLRAAGATVVTDSGPGPCVVLTSASSSATLSAKGRPDLIGMRLGKMSRGAR